MKRIGYETKSTKKQQKKLIYLLKHGTAREVAEECIKQVLGCD